MAEYDLHTNLLEHVLSWTDWVKNYFPQKNPKRKKQPGPISCYRCGEDLSDTCPCYYHEDVFILPIPTEHVGLVMGKGKTKLQQILSSSGLTRLTVSARIDTDTQTELELSGVCKAVLSGVELIAKTLHRQVRVGPGRWRCCSQGVLSAQCKICTVHLMDKIFQDRELLVETMTCARPGKVFSLDCEWVYTVRGGELARVTVLDFSGAVCYDQLVHPPYPVLDYNTRFSGITEHNITGVTTSLRQVQVNLLNIIASKDIILGHSLQHDLQVLHLVHRNVVDTSLVFPHKDGPPKRNSLKFLANYFLQRSIQQESKGHDSKEDALACLDLMKLELRVG